MNISSQLKAEEVAEKRLLAISPLLELEPGSYDMATQLTIQAEKHGVSERTLRRYLEAYKRNGFSGLKSKDKAHLAPSAIPEIVFKRAVELRTAAPKRSVQDIITILEREFEIPQNQLKRSTLQKWFERKCLSSASLRLYQDPSVGSRRFQHPHRNCLWQADIKDGVVVDGKKTYAVAIIDDCTRFVVHAECYDNCSCKIVEDSLRKAIVKFGVPDAVYCDNGGQFKNKHIRLSLANIGSKLLLTRPYSPCSKGKIEKFNHHIQKFIDEYKISGKNKDTLKDLNEKFWAFLDTWYQERRHSSLKDDMNPRLAFLSDKRPLVLRTQEEVTRAFMVKAIRKVSGGGNVSIDSVDYEVPGGLSYLGRKVYVKYDQLNLDEISVYLDEREVKCRKLIITAKAGKRPQLPASVLTAFGNQSEDSPLIRVALKDREQKLATGVSFSKLLAENNTAKDKSEEDV
jgi:transposase InsO family protein